MEAVLPLLVIFGSITVWVWLGLHYGPRKTSNPADDERLERLERELKELREMVYDAVIREDDQEVAERLQTGHAASDAAVDAS